MIINEPNNTVKTTIRKYNRLKIYQVDAIDGQLKKFTPKTANEQGCLKIYLNEKLNQIYFTIYAVNDPVKNKQIYDHMSLNEIDLDLVEAAVTQSSRKVIRFGGERDANKNVTGDVEDRKRVEFRKRDSKTVNDTLVYHAVEFNSNEALDDLANTLSYLAEAYLVKEAEADDRSEAADSPVAKAKDSKGSIDDNHANLDDSIEIIERKKDANKMIKDLQESIRRGDVKFAEYWARMLARISAKIEISLENEGNNEVMELTNEKDPTKKDVDVDRNNNNNETKRKVNVTWKKSYDDENDQDHVHIELELDVATTKVGELKLIVEDRLGLTAQKQLMIINDCSTASDQDLVNVYEPFSKRKIKEKRSEDGRASASVAQVSDDSEPYEVFVIIKDDETDEADNNSPQSNKKPKIDLSELTAMYVQDLTENVEIFACDICLDDKIEPGHGAILKECMHAFCKECLRNHVINCDEPLVKCPFRKEYACEYSLQEREVRALLSDEEYNKFHMKSLRMSEASMQNTFHCLTPDCIGFCISEDNLNFFDCPVCEKVNCLRCNTIHMGKTCKEYQDDLKISALNDKNAKKDQEALEKMIRDKKAMHCPGCKIILCKQTGCDAIMCPMCKMEICWATKGPRWGPGGKGDTSGGCKCDFARGKPCTPNCGNCH